MNIENLPYRPNVGIVLFNKKRNVFVGERIDFPGSLQMPQGGIDEGESVEQAAFRELKEETGTDKAETIKIADNTVCYDFPDHSQQKFWDGRFRGQEQTWVAMLFTGDYQDINLDLYGNPEFIQWQWVELAKTVELIVPFKREAYAQVAAMFDYLTV